MSLTKRQYEEDIEKMRNTIFDEEGNVIALKDLDGDWVSPEGYLLDENDNE